MARVKRDFSKVNNPENLLVLHGHVMDPASGIDEPGGTVWIENGRIREILSAGALLPSGVPALDASGCMVFPGLVDLHVHLRDPGRTNSEDRISGSRAALAGGFTTICAMPNTDPPPDTPERIRAFLGSCVDAYCRVLCVGAATLERSGESAVDVAACHQAGAIAFSDDGDAIARPAILRRLLQETARCGSLVTDHGEVLSLSEKAPMAAGEVQKRMNVSGQPWTAETLQLAQGILLAGETGGRYHAQHVSSGVTVAWIRHAQAMGFPVTAEVTVHHLALTDEDVATRGALAKCAPPLRSAKDRQVLLDAVRDGTITAIVTDHAPHPAQEKDRGLEAAPFGVIGLETALSVLHTLVLSKEISLSELLPALTSRPADCFGITGAGRLIPGSFGDVVVFDPAASWEVTGDFVSRSSNSPFLGMTLQGRVRATVLGGHVAYLLQDDA